MTLCRWAWEWDGGDGDDEEALSEGLDVTTVVVAAATEAAGAVMECDDGATAPLLETGCCSGLVLVLGLGLGLGLEQVGSVRAAGWGSI